MGRIPLSVYRAVIIGIAFVLFASFAQAETIPDDPYSSYQASVIASTTRVWDLATDAPNVIVAVIDTGAELDHPDLISNLWTNDGEIPDNGIDDDGNGYVDDLHGYDFRRRDGNPEDEWGHGTLTTGIIGAVGNNEIGASGVVWNVQLMILKVFGDAPGARLVDYADAIRYAVRNGATVINASWTVPPASDGDDRPVIREAIEEALDAGILVVAAAGNAADNLDDHPVFPAAYPLDNVVSVAGLKAGVSELLDESNFGAGTVKVATDGEAVLGPYLGHSYATLTGTSSSAAIVSGVAALMLGQRPDLAPDRVADILMETSETSDSLDGLVASGGAVNASASLQAALDAGTESEGVSSSDIPETPAAPSAGGCSLIPE